MCLRGAFLLILAGLVSCASSRAFDCPYDKTLQSLRRMYRPENFARRHPLKGGEKERRRREILAREGIIVPNLPVLRIKGIGFWDPLIRWEEKIPGRESVLRVDSRFKPMGYTLDLELLRRKGGTLVDRKSVV